MSAEGRSTRPEYFAIPDPLDPAKASFWYRVPSGRSAGRIEPWPPRRSHWGHLPVKDIPHDREAEPDTYRAFVDAYFARVREARSAIRASIEDEPEIAAARFAAWSIRCCMCGKKLTDQRSKVYGVGPDCRAGAPAGLVDAIAEQVRALAANA